MDFRIHFALLEHSENLVRVVEAGSILEPVERDGYLQEDFI